MPIIGAALTEVEIIPKDKTTPAALKKFLNFMPVRSPFSICFGVDFDCENFTTKALRRNHYIKIIDFIG